MRKLRSTRQTHVRAATARQIQVVEWVYVAFYQYGEKKARQLEALWEQLEAYGVSDEEIRNFCR